MGIFFGVLGFDKSLQVDQTGLPENAIMLQPGIDCLERLRVELIESMAAFAPFLHEMRSP